MPALPRFVVLYAALFAAYGVASPFLPALVNSRGIPAEQLGIILAAGTTIRLLAAPGAGRLADRIGNLRAVLCVCIAVGVFATLGYLPADRFGAFLAISMLQAAALAPMTVLADALALGASKRERFEYGWVRGTGSAAFIAGTLLSGQLVAALGLDAIVYLQAWLLACAALAALLVPEIPHAREAARERPGVRELLRIPVYRRLVLLAAAILGAHAMHDAFAMIRWREAGIGPAAAGVLWSEAVAAEVIVFFLVGPRLVSRLTPAGAVALAAGAGALRWAVMASTPEVAALALVQPLHGITFALLHLACVRLIVAHAPPGLEGTAQALYATGIGAATALLTVASGALFARYGAQAFWGMAALSALALPFALALKPRTVE